MERPASVLKELLENSLDAGADDIAVTLEDGGQSLLAVRDNGHGMPASDLELAVTRHATSKLASFTDLLSVASYGFRGEALPSIASVSDLRLESAFAGDGPQAEEAAFIHIRHGETVSSGPSSLQKGTLVTVSDIFANVPARLKFLKTPATELKRCQEVLFRLALARQDVGFSLHVGKNSGEAAKQRELIRLPAGLPLRERLQSLWPMQITEALIPFSGERGGLKAHGLASPPQAAQAKGDRMLLYVNGRPVNDRLLLRAVREAYKGRLTSREYPQAVLFLEIDPQEVDVNVHPAKTEVRFRDERAVFGAILRIMESAFADHGRIFSGFDPMGEDFANERTDRVPFTEEIGPQSPVMRQAELPPLYAGGASSTTLTSSDRNRRPSGFWGSLDTPRLVDLPEKQEKFEPVEPETELRNGNSSFSSASEDPSMHNNVFSSGRLFRDYRPTGVAEGSDPFGSFMEQTPDAFFPHAEESTNATPFAAQQAEALTPHLSENAYPIAVGPLVCLGQVGDSYLILLENDELLLLDQHAAHERVLLHTIEQETGSAQSQLLAIPAELSLHSAESERLMEVLPSLTAIGFDLATEQGKLMVRGVPPLLGRSRALEMLRDILMDKTDGIDDMLHLMACHSAIKAGQKLTSDEAAGLLRRWLSTPDREFCPHGRPIVLRFGKKELEKLFKRKIA